VDRDETLLADVHVLYQSACYVYMYVVVRNSVDYCVVRKVDIAN